MCNVKKDLQNESVAGWNLVSLYPSKDGDFMTKKINLKIADDNSCKTMGFRMVKCPKMEFLISFGQILLTLRREFAKNVGTRGCDFLKFGLTFPVQGCFLENRSFWRLSNSGFRESLENHGPQSGQIYKDGVFDLFCSCVVDSRSWMWKKVSQNESVILKISLSPSRDGNFLTKTFDLEIIVKTEQNLGHIFSRI